MELQKIETHRSFGGQQIKYRHLSETLHCEMTFSVYLPETTVENQEIPLIWWLAGLTSTDDNFSIKGGFQRYAAEQQIAFVMPDTSPRGDVADSEDWDLGQGAGFYLNATQEPWKKDFQMYDYLTKELTEIIYSLIPNLSGKESIMGHSMGGHGSLVIGLKNPARFASISAFAPISNPSNVPWGQKAFTAYLGADQATWSEWDATELIKKETTSQPPILITQGTADPFYEVQLNEEAFLTAAESAKHEVFYQKEEGYDHSYFTIATFVEQHIAFHATYLKQ
ncbi:MULTISPECIES: S-formylglutathione hydrolase [Enterococcus]|uniref:S-formylglutathione hydrolase n=1 Tax=Enterococcus TaxID=1350 RepID=UPI000DFBFE23|nr:S-formylglutathione hydrolase [Enterococcus mundtii]STD22162.1 esterase [Enterococcus mundtii]